MFNNPFDSFHDTVAEAKEEREQLERLLTVSTPRERLLVTLTALLLVILLAWLFLGSVPRSLAVEGVFVGPGETQSGAGRTVQALIWIEQDDLPGVGVGMPAVIELGPAGDARDTFSGVVTSVSAVSLSELPASFAPAAPVSVRRVDIALDDRPDLTSAVGRECRIVFETGTQSPAAFLRLGPT